MKRYLRVNLGSQNKLLRKTISPGQGSPRGGAGQPQTPPSEKLCPPYRVAVHIPGFSNQLSASAPPINFQNFASLEDARAQMVITQLNGTFHRRLRRRLNFSQNFRKPRAFGARTPLLGAFGPPPSRKIFLETTRKNRPQQGFHSGAWSYFFNSLSGYNCCLSDFVQVSSFMIY